MGVQAMSEVVSDYELKMMEMVINKYLDETASITEQYLKKIEANRDQVVWDLVTRIYSESGHKLELSIVRDVVNSRIESIKFQLPAEKERLASIYAQRVAEEKARLAAEKERLAAEKACWAAEMARRSAAEDARLKAEKARLKAEAEEKLLAVAAKEARERAEIASVVGRLGGNESKYKVFVRVKKIACEQLSVDENKVSLDSHLEDDLNADGLDLIELIMALEEEFDIEIPDEEAKNILGINTDIDSVMHQIKEPKSNIGTINRSQQSYRLENRSVSSFSTIPSDSPTKEVEKIGLIKNLVDLIYEKISV
jgi:acyl carrier protein